MGSSTGCYTAKRLRTNQSREIACHRLTHSTGSVSAWVIWLSPSAARTPAQLRRLEPGLDAPREALIEGEMDRNDDLGPGGKILRGEHPNHRVGFAIQLQRLSDGFSTPGEMPLPESIG
jgi:hypothetical protein